MKRDPKAATHTRSGYSEMNTQTGPVTPPGLEAVYTACRRLYPDQPNPLQVTAVVKYWLGGPDPLDYISMYSNPGDPEHEIAPHWHYVSFGLSDLHGDGRVHEPKALDGPSGFGFELTFRLKREAEETAPPTWPAALMQALSRYVFQSDNTLCNGDHISWHSPLDGTESRIQHMLITEDVQLQPLNTPLGTVQFLQIIGVCQEELKSAQHWNGPGVLDLLKSIPVAGGPWLITDMRRGESIFEADPHLQERVDQGIEHEGSNLSGVSGRCTWEEPSHSEFDTHNEDNKENRHVACCRRDSNEIERPHISHYESEQIKQALKIGLKTTASHTIKQEPTEVHPEQNGSRKESFDSNVSSEASTELLRTRSLDTVHLKFNLEAGSLLPLAIRGRLKHGRHFTFKSVLNDVAITLVSTNIQGSLATEQQPYAAHGPWLQVLLTDEFIDQLQHELEVLSNPEDLALPYTFTWPEKHFAITILQDET